MKPYNEGARYLVEQHYASDGTEYEADVYGDDKPMLVDIVLLGSCLEAFVAGRSMIAWKDGEPVLVEVI